MSDLAALADGATSQTVATGYLKDVSPEDARLLDYRPQALDSATAQMK